MIQKKQLLELLEALRRVKYACLNKNASIEREAAAEQVGFSPSADDLVRCHGPLLWAVAYFRGQYSAQQIAELVDAFLGQLDGTDPELKKDPHGSGFAVLCNQFKQYIDEYY